jgi:hypothetical protein
VLVAPSVSIRPSPIQVFQSQQKEKVAKKWQR